VRLPDAWRGPYWKPCDAWIGAYWSRELTQVAKHERSEIFTLYICLVPCFPIRLTWVDNAVPATAPDDAREGSRE
jgi:hypothetical protein